METICLFFLDMGIYWTILLLKPNKNEVTLLLLARVHCLNNVIKQRTTLSDVAVTKGSIRGGSKAPLNPHFFRHSTLPQEGVFHTHPTTLDFLSFLTKLLVAPLFTESIKETVSTNL